MTPVLIADRISVAFGGQTVLAEIDLRCDAGEFVALLGPSGCGKSTLLRLFAGLRQPTDGRLAIGSGQDTAIGFVFQDPTLLPWRTVRQNVELPLELRGVSQAERRRPVADALQLVGLHEADTGKYPRQLSGGMRMRVSIARALVTSPQVMLLDEPFAALDEILRQELNEELLRLWKLHGWTTLFVTHSVQEAVYLSQRIVILSPSPAKVATVVDVPFAYPRAAGLRGTAEFAALEAHVSSLLREGSR